MDTGLDNISFQVNTGSGFEEILATSVETSDNLTMETWHDLRSKFANNQATALDPTWNITMKLDSSTNLAQFIMGKKYSVGTLRTTSMKMINLLEDKQLTFTGVFGDIDYTMETPTVVEISFDIKIATNTTVVESTYSETSV